MSKTDELRERAEEELQKAKEQGYIPVNVSELMHELQVHQMELQIQNEELRTSQEEISSLYNQYHELYEYAPIGYFTLDKDGIIRNVNAKGSKLLQLNKKDIIGRGFGRFILKDGDKYYCALANAIDTDEIQSVELQLKGNKMLYVYMEIMLVHRSDERYRITITDITRRKKIEEKLGLVHENLEKQVAERTVELRNTVKELKEANEELRQFAYVSSHDLQEPLRTIASFTQLLERRYKGKLDSDADEFIGYIVDAALRMKQQILDLLEFSRVTTNKEEFKLVDTSDILNQAIRNLYISIKKSKAEITYEKLPNVMGNTGQLQRVFQNLISNAIRFRKCEKPLKIHILAYKAENENEYVFTVKDNGIGIEEQYFERIFTIFQRLHTREEYHGTGIGLSIVKRIIERHNGSIWVESEFGAGSTFYFTIPIK
jgi:PAS domain S-box-containing protein